jgi:hypothetical protein
MNNRGKTLTTLVIATLAFITVISLAIIANDDFYSGIIPTGQNDSGIYNSSLGNLSDTTNMQTGILNPLSPSTNFFADVFKSGVTIFTTTMIGLNTLKTFLTLPGILIGIFQNIGSTLPLGSSAAPLIWFFTSAASIYIVMKFIQAVRGTINEA